VLFDAGDSLGPGALTGGVRIGKACGVLALGFSEDLEGVVEALLEGLAGHDGILACFGFALCVMSHIPDPTLARMKSRMNGHRTYLSFYVWAPSGPS
jgi:hypothetical protein